MALGASEFAYLRQLVREQAAIVLEADQEYLAQTRLAGLARSEGFVDVDELVAHLRGQPPGSLHQKAIEVMATHETTFFRDVQPFEALRTKILPDLFERRAEERRLNVWCAACSSGQEPYSLLILLHEHFPLMADWSIRVLASDLSREMLARAALGQYSRFEVTRGLPPHLLRTYFRPVGAEWQVRADLRKSLELIQINLAQPWPRLPPLDLVMMRNVLIYFDLDTRRDVLQRVRRLLRPDGYLVLGAAETPIGVDDDLEQIVVGRSSFYRVRPAGSQRPPTILPSTIAEKYR